MLNQTVIKRPGLRSKSNKQGGNRKPQTFKICICGKEFGPVYALKQKFCSKKCHYQNAPKTVNHKHIRTKEAMSANRKLSYHIQTGKIIRLKICEECGTNNKRIEGAHFSYKEPLKVRWPCKSCHVRWDKSEPKGGTYIVARWEKFTGQKAELLNEQK